MRSSSSRQRPKWLELCQGSEGRPRKKCAGRCMRCSHQKSSRTHLSARAEILSLAEKLEDGVQFDIWLLVLWNKRHATLEVRPRDAQVPHTILALERRSQFLPRAAHEQISFGRRSDLVRVLDDRARLSQLAVRLQQNAKEVAAVEAVSLRQQLVVMTSQQAILRYAHVTRSELRIALRAPQQEVEHAPEEEHGRVIWQHRQRYLLELGEAILQVPLDAAGELRMREAACTRLGYLFREPVDLFFCELHHGLRLLAPILLFPRLCGLGRRNIRLREGLRGLRGGRGFCIIAVVIAVLDGVPLLIVERVCALGGCDIIWRLPHRKQLGGWSRWRVSLLRNRVGLDLQIGLGGRGKHLVTNLLVLLPARALAMVIAIGHHLALAASKESPDHATMATPERR